MERGLRNILFGCAQVVSGSVALFTVLSVFASLFLLGELLVHFKVFYLLGAAASAGAFALGRRWRWLVFAALLVAIHLPGVLVWYLPVPDTPAGLVQSNLRIVTANLLKSNLKHDLFLEFIADADPDIIFIQEIDDAWAVSLRALEEAYPYSELLPSPGDFGIALFSRVPLDPVEIVYYTDSVLPWVHAGLTVNGRHLSVLSYHTWPPVSRERLETRDGDLDFLAKYVADAEDLVLVAGDFNVTPWSPSYKKMIRASGLKNARRGFGIKPTWSVIPSPVALLPLDHVLLSPEIAVKSLRVGPRIGSDHRPLIVDLAVPPPPP